MRIPRNPNEHKEYPPAPPLGIILPDGWMSDSPKAMIHLCDKLNELPRRDAGRRKVCYYLDRFSLLINQLEYIPQVKVRIDLIQMFRKRVLADYPYKDTLSGLAHNVMHTMYARALKRWQAKLDMQMLEVNDKVNLNDGLYLADLR